VSPIVGLVVVATALWLAAVACAAAVAAVWAAQRLGRARAERDFHAKTSDTARRSATIEDEVESLPAGELDRRLHTFQRE
jgi:hypothetical protein